MKIYKLRCKSTHKYLAEDDVVLTIRQTTSGRQWKKRSAPMSMLYNLIHRIYSDMIRSNGCHPFDKYATDRNLIPIQLVTLENGVILDVEDIDYEALKKKAINHIIYEVSMCHHIYLSDYLNGKLIDGLYYHARIINDSNQTISFNQSILKKEITSLGLSRSMKVEVVHTGFYHRADFRFLNSDTMMVWKLGNTASLEDYTEMNMKRFDRDLSRLNRILGLSL